MRCGDSFSLQKQAGNTGSVRVRHARCGPWGGPESVAAELHRDHKSLPNLTNGDISVARLFSQLLTMSDILHLSEGVYTTLILLAS